MMKVDEKDILPVLADLKNSFAIKITSDESVVQMQPDEAEKTLARWEKTEAALERAMDIVYDYQSMAEQLSSYQERDNAKEPIYRGTDLYTCPVCGRRCGVNNSYCHWCGQKMDWESKMRGVKKRCRK